MTEIPVESVEWPKPPRRGRKRHWKKFIAKTDAALRIARTRLGFS